MNCCFCDGEHFHAGQAFKSAWIAKDMELMERLES